MRLRTRSITRSPIGARSVHCLAGCVSPEQRPAAESVFVANLARAAEAAAEAGIMLLIEPLNPRDRPDYFVSRVEHAAHVVRKVGAPHLRIQFDFYHVQIVSGDLIRRFEAYRPLIGHLQIASVPERHEPDEGEVNYPEILAHARSARLRGLRRRASTARAAAPRTGSAWARPYGVVPRG